MDDGLSKAVLRFFVELYRQGLMYRDKRLVNWESEIPDGDFRSRKCSSSRSRAISGTSATRSRASRGASSPSRTKRAPRPCWAITGVAVHPEDARYRDLVGKHVILPLVGRRIPIVADEYSDPEIGSGAVKMTPAHDFNDFDVGKRQNLRMVNIFDPEAQIWLEGNDAFLEGLSESADLTETIDPPRSRSLRGPQAHRRDDGGAPNSWPRSRTTPIPSPMATVPACPIEPYLTDQWYVDVKPARREGHGRRARRAYQLRAQQLGRRPIFQWLENIEPWCVSRQLWWGHQIPAWYDEDGNVFVAYDEAGGEGTGA